MVEPLVTPVLNGLLRTNRWALEALRVHAGKSLAVEAPPFSLRFTVTDTGELAPAAEGAAIATSIRIPPPALPRFVLRDPTAWTEVVVAGEAELAQTVDHVRRRLEWDYEEALSGVFGDIAAHRIGLGIRAFDRWVRTASVDLGRAFAEYAAHEAPLVASAEGLHEFAREVDEIRAAVDRLEARVAALARSDAAH